jgi:DNA-binding protein Fis
MSLATLDCPQLIFKKCSDIITFRISPDQNTVSSKPSHIRFALLTQDPDLKSRVQGPELQNAITVLEDCSSLETAMRSQQFTGVILDESGPKFFPALSALNGQLNLSKTFIYAGPLPAWSTLSQIRQIMGDQPMDEGAIDPKDVSLASYVEKKLGDFVRAMNVGSGKNLYPTLMRAVERPLIELALRETHGNQIKAARLLGLNRNTLRKKITEFQISLSRVKQSSAGKRKKAESD